MTSTARKSVKEFTFLANVRHEAEIRENLDAWKVWYLMKSVGPEVYFTVRINQNYWLTIRKRFIYDGILVKKIKNVL